MPHIITEPCIGTKDTACAKVCPVECFYDAGDLLVIHPEECIDCGACIPECPVVAILPLEYVPDDEKEFIARNADFIEEKGEELEELRVLAD